MNSELCVGSGGCTVERRTVNRGDHLVNLHGQIFHIYKIIDF